MKKCNIKVHQISKKRFYEMTSKIEKFLKDNFEQTERGSSFDSSRAYVTDDRSKVIQFVKGLKVLEFEQFEHDRLEYIFQKWQLPISKESNMLKEENMISFTWKGLTPSKKLACASYITIGEKNGKYIVSISETVAWRGYSGKPWREFDLLSSFSGTICMAREWSNTVHRVSSERNRIRIESNRIEL